MIQHVLGLSPTSFWPIVGLMIFFVIYMFVVLKSFGKKEKGEFSHLSKLPLEHENQALNSDS